LSILSDERRAWYNHAVSAGSYEPGAEEPTEEKKSDQQISSDHSLPQKIVVQQIPLLSHGGAVLTIAMKIFSCLSASPLRSSFRTADRFGCGPPTKAIFKPPSFVLAINEIFVREYGY
jgi:hypothetical protein